MSKFLKALIISVAMFVSHVLIMAIAGNFYEERGTINYGIIASSIYIFIVAFWAYYLLTLVYVVISAFITTPLHKTLVALIVMMIGYLLSRTGDIIDGDFVERFRRVPFILFVLSSLLLVLFEKLVSTRIVKRQGKNNS